MEDWYDYPQYFDMVFRDETAAEVDFFEAAFDRFGYGKVGLGHREVGRKKVCRLLEPGCGSGRLVAAMASRGYDVTGLDLNPAMLNYLRKRLLRRKLKSTLVQGDMTQMAFRRPFDAAFCTFNTFRHLTSEQSARNHLISVAKNLVPGGLYILGFHCIPLDADTDSDERWRASHGGTSVHMTLKVVAFDRKNRQEVLRASIKAETRSGKIHRVRSEFPLRLYTIQQAMSLFASVKDHLELVEVYDFDYDIDNPRRIDDDLTDAVFVFRKH